MSAIKCKICGETPTHAVVHCPVVCKSIEDVVCMHHCFEECEYQNMTLSLMHCMWKYRYPGTIYANPQKVEEYTKKNENENDFHLKEWYKTLLLQYKMHPLIRSDIAPELAAVRRILWKRQ